MMHVIVHAHLRKPLQERGVFETHMVSFVKQHEYSSLEDLHITGRCHPSLKKGSSSGRSEQGHLGQHVPMVEKGF